MNRFCSGLGKSYVRAHFAAQALKQGSHRVIGASESSLQKRRLSKLTLLNICPFKLRPTCCYAVEKEEGRNPLSPPRAPLACPHHRLVLELGRPSRPNQQHASVQQGRMSIQGKSSRISAPRVLGRSRRVSLRCATNSDRPLVHPQAHLGTGRHRLADRRYVLSEPKKETTR